MQISYFEDFSDKKEESLIGSLKYKPRITCNYQWLLPE